MTIPIFYACDDNFLKYTIVSLTSMIQNASKRRNYHVYVLNTNIPEASQARVLALQTKNFKISFVNVTDYLDSISERLPLRHYYTKTTYFRFFIAEMFPEYDKAIYIDSDTIVQGDISRLYDTNIGNNYLGACHEQAMAQIDVFGTYCERVVGVSRKDYFNAGVMLINCEQFRLHHVLDRFIHYLGIYNFAVTQDEDYLNLICKNRVYHLDQHWNTELTDGLVFPYDVREGFILHYIMVNKPWHYEDCRLADVFWQYAALTSEYEVLRAELEAYTDEERARDQRSAENLAQLAISETEKVVSRRPARSQRPLRWNNPVFVYQKSE